MLEVDGSAGGGQLLRSALSLSVLTDTPVRIVNVRGGRSDPGLKAQHVAAVEAATLVAEGEVSGNDLGSESVEFTPGSRVGGDHDVEIATAGSLTLVYETVLPMALCADEPTRLHATGGTDVKWAPPIEYLRAVKLPLLRTFGLLGTVECHRRGFFPVGGGRATLTLAPSALDPIQLPSDPSIDGIWAVATASDDLEDASVAERLVTTVTTHLDEWARDTSIDAGAVTADATPSPVHSRTTQYVDVACTGAVLLAGVETDNGSQVLPIAGPSALGEPGTPAEKLATAVAEETIEFVRSGASVDRSLADQLLLPLAIAGGSIVIPTVTQHVETSLGLLEEFDLDVTCTAREDGWLLEADGFE